MRRKVVSIFSGIDCLGLGFREKFDIKLAVEIESKACNTLIANKDKFHPNMEIWNRDIVSVSDSEIEDLKGIDGIIGGPPCQAWSAAIGAFNPSDERLRYVFEYLRWVKIIKPKFFLFENVEGIVQKSKIHLFEEFINLADEIGYDVKYQVLNCHDYGSAQKRKRLFAIGFRKDLNVDFKFPTPVENKKYVRDILDTDVTGDFVQVRARIKEIMPYVPEGGYWKDLKTEELLIKALGVNYKKREGGMTGICRRLHRDKPCPTLTTSPVQNSTLLYHPIEERPLSVSEYKRAQGIPDEYEVIGSVTDQYKFIGNGVPVEVATELSKAISKVLDSIKSI